MRLILAASSVRFCSLFLVCCLACADDSSDRARLESIQNAYSAAIAEDFPAALYGEKVSKVLRALDAFEASDTLRLEAGDLAQRIRQTQERNPLAENQPDKAGDYFAQGTEVLPEASSLDPAEAIWMKTLRIGTFRADFERYWLGCFQPVSESADAWRPLDVPPCRRRPGLERIAEVRFEGGRISELLTYEQQLNAKKPPSEEAK